MISRRSPLFIKNDVVADHFNVAADIDEAPFELSVDFLSDLTELARLFEPFENSLSLLPSPLLD